MLLLFALASSIAVAPCDTTDRIVQLRAAQQHLFSIGNEPDDLPTDAPLAAQSGVPAMREALASAITSYMTCEAVNVPEPVTLQHDIAAVLNANHPLSSVEKHNGYPEHPYGDDLSIAVKPLGEHSTYVAIDTSFSTGCGEDHAILVFHRMTNAWTRTLDWHSSKYNKVSDAFGDFFLYTPTPGPNGSQLIAVAYGYPWCTSRLSGFEVDLLQPATSTTVQRVIAHTHADYSRGDTTPSLKPWKEGVTLRLDASSRDLDNVFTFIGVFRYRTTDGSLQRLPVANNVRDFVDSWLDETWPLPPGWSAPSSDLQATHDRFDYARNPNVLSLNYGPTLACGTNSQHFEVEIDPTDGTHDLPPLYAQVQQDTGSFTMLAFTSKLDPACTGPDLLKKH